MELEDKSVPIVRVTYLEEVLVKQYTIIRDRQPRLACGGIIVSQQIDLCLVAHVGDSQERLVQRHPVIHFNVYIRPPVRQNDVRPPSHHKGCKSYVLGECDAPVHTNGSRHARVTFRIDCLRDLFDAACAVIKVGSLRRFDLVRPLGVCVYACRGIVCVRGLHRLPHVPYRHPLYGRVYLPVFLVIEVEHLRAHAQKPLVPDRGHPYESLLRVRQRVRLAPRGHRNHKVRDVHALRVLYVQRVVVSRPHIAAGAERIEPRAHIVQSGERHLHRCKPRAFADGASGHGVARPLRVRPAYGEDVLPGRGVIRVCPSHVLPHRIYPVERVEDAAPALDGELPRLRHGGHARLQICVQNHAPFSRIAAVQAGLYPRGQAVHVLERGDRLP